MNVPVWDKDAQLSTALIPAATMSPGNPPKRLGGRPRADFVAHLIATSAQAPQTRTRRRAEPRDAAAAYCGVGHWPTRVGSVLARSL